jgi:hypothetical protein
LREEKRGEGEKELSLYKAVTREASARSNG